MSKARTGGRILVDNLVAQGCDRIFTVPGESFLAVLDALHDTPDIQTIVCRQEGGVSYMAEADGKVTGRPGIAFVTTGPPPPSGNVAVHGTPGSISGPIRSPLTPSALTTAPEVSPPATIICPTPSLPRPCGTAGSAFSTSAPARSTPRSA